MMTEEINYSYDGGLYAEMVRNRSFTDRGWAGIGHWNLDSAGNAHATAKYDNETGPSDALSGSMRIDVTEADAANPAGVRNDGWWGMALQPNTTYTGSLYAKTEGTGSIGVSLVSDTTGQAVATAAISGVSSAWKQYSFTLKTGSITPSALNHLLLSFPQTGKVWIDLVSLFPPTYKDRANGNRPDLMEMMAAMHPKFLRLPGGNYLEGDQIDERFDWEADARPAGRPADAPQPVELPVDRRHGPARVSGVDGRPQDRTGACRVCRLLAEGRLHSPRPHADAVCRRRDG